MRRKKLTESWLLASCYLATILSFLTTKILFAQQVTLGWTSSPHPYIDSYNIYRAPHADSSFTILATVIHPDSTFLDDSMEWNTHYYYVATSVDQFGSESGFSNRIDTTLQLINPVELHSFSARIINSNNIILDWSTATESNNFGFFVQRRSDANPKLFADIGFVKGNGTAVEPQHYLYTDVDVPEGVHYYRIKQIDFDGSFKFSAAIEITIALPATARLYQNYPNPFNSSTEITYHLPASGHVELIIYDTIGHQVCRLVDTFQMKGKYTVKWDASDFIGKEVGSGIYYYKIESGSFCEFRKMMLIK